MNLPDTRKRCDQYRDLIDRFADGELDSNALAALEGHVLVCQECALELALARRIDREFHSLPFQQCPPDVTQTVFAYAASRPAAHQRPKWWQVWQPALAGALAAILLLVTAFVGQNAKYTTPQYTRAELEQARAEAKWTLLFINQLSRKAATDLRDDVLRPHVVRKMIRLVDPRLNSAPKENEHAS